jgi:hypothetical protein
MDISKEYLAMCEAAGEIQFFSDSDSRIGIPVWFYQYPGKGMNWEICERVGLAYDEDYPDGRTKAVWLPTQDQLQELFFMKLAMSKEEEDIEIYKRFGITEIIYMFYHFVFGEQFERAEEKAVAMEYSCNFNSLEQLWLAFIMQMKYEKRWDGKKWVIQ